MASFLCKATDTIIDIDMNLQVIDNMNILKTKVCKTKIELYYDHITHHM